MMLVPLRSTFADNFAVTTNKNTYSQNERVFIFGITPSDTSQGSSVRVELYGPSGQLCKVVNLVPDSDNTFVSKPLNLSACGTGGFHVNANYLGLNSTSSFEISNKGKQSLGNDPVMKKLKQDLAVEQLLINSRVREYSDSGGNLSSDFVEKYSEGKQESSAAIQAIEFGNATDAKLHGQAAIDIFKKLSDSLQDHPNPPMKAATANQERKVDSQNLSSITEEMTRLRSYLDQLQKLASANGIDYSQSFNSASNSLAEVSTSLAQNDTSGAKEKLDNVSLILDGIHSDLYSRAQQNNINSTIAHQANNSTADNGLVQAADRIESADNALLASNATKTKDVRSMIEDSLNYVSKARNDLAQGNYEQARKDLANALSLMAHAKSSMIESSHHKKNHK